MTEKTYKLTPGKLLKTIKHGKHSRTEEHELRIIESTLDQDGKEITAKETPISSHHVKYNLVFWYDHINSEYLTVDDKFYKSIHDLSVRPEGRDFVITNNKDGTAIHISRTMIINDAAPHAKYAEVVLGEDLEDRVEYNTLTFNDHHRLAKFEDDESIITHPEILHGLMPMNSNDVLAISLTDDELCSKHGICYDIL